MISLFERAEAILPGGVNSPVRAFRGVGGEPVFVRSAQGAYLEGEDGRRYIDYIGGYGPHILGHRHPAIVAAIKRPWAAARPSGLRLSPRWRSRRSSSPPCPRSRWCGSSARAPRPPCRPCAWPAPRPDATEFVKFEGCYHGHADPFLIAAGSGAATIGVPSSPGVPDAVVADTLLAPYNDLEAVERLFGKNPPEHRRHHRRAHRRQHEPGAARARLPRRAARAVRPHGSLLIFDEVMTGFRVAWGGAQNPARHPAGPDAPSAR